MWSIRAHNNAELNVNTEDAPYERACVISDLSPDENVDILLRGYLRMTLRNGEVIYSEADLTQHRDIHGDDEQELALAIVFAEMSDWHDWVLDDNFCRPLKFCCSAPMLYNAWESALDKAL